MLTGRAAKLKCCLSSRWSAAGHPSSPTGVIPPHPSPTNRLRTSGHLILGAIRAMVPLASHRNPLILYADDITCPESALSTLSELLHAHKNAITKYTCSPCRCACRGTVTGHFPLSVREIITAYATEPGASLSFPPNGRGFVGLREGRCPPAAG